ncbi:T9SS type A sorting domain-containing protein [Aquiflexum lacus]|uniref:T9SS type A sorting domain-containing protein n=1 Tax=Aquiflexum lacus TaxID=2483805 RepID=UPI0018950F93|nr:T9SS type A sorting domain-containing protein [Aquiflexum lacus]
MSYSNETLSGNILINGINENTNTNSTYSANITGIRKKTNTPINESIFVAKGDTVTINPPLQIDTETNELCREVYATATGGTGNYTYYLTYFNDSTVQSENGIFRGLIHSDFTVSVKDSEGCEDSQYIQLPFYGEIPQTPNISIVPKTIPSPDVSLTTDTTGIFSYVWFLDSVQIPNSNSPIISITQSGNYQVKVISVAGCESNLSDNFLINWYPINIDDAFVDDVRCFGEENGRIVVAASVGEGNLEYSLGGQPFISTGSFNQLEAGEYTVFIRGSQNTNYVISRVFSVSQPDPIEVVVLEQTGPSCPGENTGNIRVAASGGTGESYQYEISGDEENINNSGVFGGLSEGSYTIWVYDEAGCSTSVDLSLTPQTDDVPSTPQIFLENPQSPTSDVFISSDNLDFFRYVWYLNGVEIPNSDNPRFQVTQSGTYQLQAFSESGCGSKISEPYALNWYPINMGETFVENVRCFMENNGRIEISATVGEGTLEYSIDGQNFISTNSFNQLEAGEYTVFIRGSQNTNYVISRVFSVSQPDPIEVVVLEQTGPSCPGENTGNIRVAASGGTGESYQYEISGDEENINNSGVFGGLSEGSYTIWVYDEGGCSTSVDLSLTPQTDDVPSTPQIFLENPQNPSSEVLLSSDNTESFRYVWFRNEVEIPNSDNPRLQVTQSGTYQLQAFSESGCGSEISEPYAINWYPINIGETFVENVRCFGGNNGRIEISATVGEGTLEYSIDGHNFISINSFNQLEAGEYTVFIRGSQNTNYVIRRVFSVSQPDPIEVVVLEQTGPSCPNETSGRIRVAANGGNGNYTFEIPSEGIINSDGEFEGFAEGIFSLIARDENGCERTVEIQLSAQADFPPIPVISILGPDGTPSGVRLASSSTINNQWIINGFEVPNGTEQFYEIRQPGIYQVRVTNEFGCSAISESLVISEITPNRIFSSKIYPNPAEGFIKVTFEQPTILGTLKLFSANGTLVKDLGSNIQVQDFIEINLENIAPGFYILLLDKELIRFLKK